LDRNWKNFSHDERQVDVTSTDGYRSGRALIEFTLCAKMSLA